MGRAYVCDGLDDNIPAGIHTRPPILGFLLLMYVCMYVFINISM